MNNFSWNFFPDSFIYIIHRHFSYPTPFPFEIHVHSAVHLLRSWNANLLTRTYPRATSTEFSLTDSPAGWRKARHQTHPNHTARAVTSAAVASCGDFASARGIWIIPIQNYVTYDEIAMITELESSGEFIAEFTSRWTRAQRCARSLSRKTSREITNSVPYFHAIR